MGSRGTRSSCSQLCKIGKAIGDAVAKATAPKIVKVNAAPVIFQTHAPTYIHGCKTKDCLPATATPTSRDMPHGVPAHETKTNFMDGVIQMPLPPVRPAPLKPTEVCRSNVTQNCLCPFHKTGVQTCEGDHWGKCYCEGSLCIPGETQACFCPGGRKTGTQSCMEDGEMWGRCLCTLASLKYMDPWKRVLSKGQLGTRDVGAKQFNAAFHRSPTHVIKRVCATCKKEYRVVYYKRLTLPGIFNPYTYMKDSWSDKNNELNKDFALYSSLFDLERDQNRWKYCNFNDPGVGFPRDCGKTQAVHGQWSTWKPTWAGQQSVAYYIQMHKIPHPRFTEAPVSKSPTRPKSAIWKKLLSKGSYGNMDAGAKKFDEMFRKSRTHIIKRMCGKCGPEHRVMYYRRLTKAYSFAPYSYMKNDWKRHNNILNKDFGLYSSYSDAIQDTGRWQFCNYDDPGIGFPRDCGKTGSVGGNWNSWRRGGRKDVAFYVDIS